MHPRKYESTYLLTTNEATLNESSTLDKFYHQTTMFLYQKLWCSDEQQQVILFGDFIEDAKKALMSHKPDEDALF